MHKSVWTSILGAPADVIGPSAVGKMRKHYWLQERRCSERSSPRYVKSIPRMLLDELTKGNPVLLVYALDDTTMAALDIA